MASVLDLRPEEQALWWLHRLESDLQSRQAKMEEFDSYYRGDHPLPFITPSHAAKLRNEFRRLLEESRTNFTRLVVDVVEERLRVDGFRLSASSDQQADKASWDIWQANAMDSESQVALVEALVKGVTYLSVWAGEEYPTIAVEDPTQVIVGYEPGSNYRKRAAALKVWQDDYSDALRANVYLPGGIYKFEAARSTSDMHAPVSAASDDYFGGAMTPVRRLTESARRWRELPDEFVGNPLGEVPIVPLRNRPRLRCEGESEISDVVQVQNQINGFLFLLALAGYFGAHRQRWAVGLTMAQDGEKLENPIDTAIDRVWADTNPEAKFGDFAQTDLDGYIRAIEQKILHIAVTTRTPRHYLIEQGQSPSGDAIKSAESGLTKKVERKMRPFGEGFEEAMRLARRFAGEGDAPVDSEIVWADPEVRTEAEITDAAIKRFQAGLTDRQQTLEDLGYSATQIARILASEPEPAPTPAPPAVDDPEVVTV